MSITIHPAHAFCERQDKFVFLEQTEGQCRDRHNCSDAACPLEKELGHNRFNRVLSILAASYGEVLGIR